MSLPAVNTETGELLDSDVLNYRVHPVAALFPYIEGAAFAEFVEDIRRHGQREPVVLDAEDRLLDGRNRARACQRLGIDVKETRYSGDDAEAWIISHNVQRRHLTESQRAMIAARLANMQQGERTDLQSTDRRSTSVPEAATALSIGVASVGRAKAVLKSGDADLIRSVETGEVTVTKAAEQVRAEHRKPATAGVGRGHNGSSVAHVKRIAEMAAQGYSSRQIAPKLSLSEPYVRHLAREHEIEIAADRYVANTRRINSTQLVENTATALEGLVSGIELIDYDDVDPATASQWADSLKDSVSKLRSFANQIDRKATQ